MLEKFKAALILFALVAACGTQDYYSLPKYAVNDILSDYRENEAAAERKYRGQQFAIIGKVKGIEARRANRGVADACVEATDRSQGAV